MQWLRVILKSGEHHYAREIFAQGQLKGFSVKTLKRAKKALGIEADQWPTGWVWRWPSDSPEDPEGQNP